MEQALSQLLADFAHNPVSGGKEMRRLLEADREKFLLSSLPWLRAAPQTQAFNYLLALLLTNGRILEQLTNPELFSLDEAINLARPILRIEPLLDIKLVRTLLDTKDTTSREELEKKADSDRGIRLLDIMAAISDGARILPVMAQLLRHPNSRVRSKAALLVGRSNKNYQWVEQRMGEGDPRVRANALESLWGVDSVGARNVLWAAVSDPDNRVAGNALYGLYQLGEPRSIPALLQMLNHPQEDFRSTAVWIMGETGDPRFLPVLARLMSDSESKIRAAVFRGIAKLKQNMAKLLGPTPIEVHVGQVELMAGGWRRVRISVCTPGGPGEHAPELACLKPTQFVIYDQANLIAEYDVVEETHTEPLFVAFAYPRVAAIDTPLQRRLEQSFSGAVRHKRKGDAWLTLSYSCDKREQTAGAGPGASVPKIEERQIKPAPLSLLPDLRFSTEPEAILSQVSNPGSRLSSAGKLVEAAQILLSTSASVHGRRHLILLHHSHAGQLSAEACHDLARAARTNKIAIHVVASEPVPAMREICATTGGFFLERPPEDLPRTMEALCANLKSHYCVRLRVETPDSERGLLDLRFQVFAEQGSGEGTFSLSARPERELAAS